ncbi:hypothetical protein OW492_00300 [Psychromonas sp. 14N.309.X.WAT.B.A12]|uniref:hypothetical protein n=1 Tax=Psychromonas sp. 14N.309.X.WAT.B.A12 TaxID=2998322 RepID=UPI0025B09FDA|nr:hypothetical protein [Psychromonas sp. 14N.309.X.WAT.B.A12]MDN2661811.1 hypothetical protein [Psychromonas sp. 14N.309.X.WAT.B.A12]
MQTEQSSREPISIEINTLLEVMQELHQKVEKLERNGGYQGWMTIKQAASLVGISRDALAQRIVSEQYPEHVVWRQKSKGCSIMINLHELNKIF